ncbi:amino acid ABC transporter substrate-binding protein [Rheinheimera mesophila]|uniref:Amino acid ABC transporter substrate-binding protein n=1 Tax=Rheinheimera mesophila TaxID=1547515 RepID=A0A3P3QT90_9GAMM|nr:transporter substrate-binding domain-containing protein [Rheinheimera mesophila]RRJ23719.1 amino acid ABC transporter substrate-binding protein [Rheinheimera mesophila]
MKRRSVLILLLVVAGLNSPAAAGPDLLVVTEPMPVFQQIENGQIAGANTLLVRRIIAEAGLTAEFQMYPWARAYSLALNQPDVLIYGIAKTKERERLFHWIGPLAAFQLGFIRLKTNSKAAVKQLTQARELTIAVQRQDSTYDFLAAQGFVEAKQLVVVADAEQSWLLLANGKVDLIVDNPVLLPALARTTGLAESAFEVTYLIPELALQAYLAASIKTKPTKIKQLQRAYLHVMQQANKAN